MKQPRPDSAEEIEELRSLGATRLEIDGVNYWKLPTSPRNWGGAANALAFARGEPIPFPLEPMQPWLGG